MHSEDARLIAMARAGDVQSFEQLYQKYRAPVYRTALGITKDVGLAEEVQQDCFLRAYDCLDRLNAAPSIGPWLRRVTINLCLNHLRRQRPQVVPLETREYALEPPATVSVDVLHDRKELMQMVRNGLHALNGRHRRVLVLHYLQGFSVDEISDMLDCPVGTVKSRLYYARQRLGETLKPQEGFAAAD